MPSEVPVVFLAFSNELDRHLDSLKVESRGVYDALQPLRDSNLVEVHREESAEFGELYDDLLAYDGRIVIFHYGGHANGQQLHLEGGNGNAVGIARMLGQQENLKLVFLNGCATKGQVSLLLEEGVPAVVATSVPIGDTKAQQFSVAFYKALAKGRGMSKAFDSARSKIEGKAVAEGEAPVIFTRGARIEDVDDAEPADIPWSLYTRPDITEDLKGWRLTTARSEWQTQLVDALGPIRDLAGEPLALEHHQRSRTLATRQCKQCLTKVVVDDTPTACPVCGGKAPAADLVTLVPDQIVPFLIHDRDHASALVKKHLHGSYSGPLNLRKVYVPHWLFDVDTHVKLSADRSLAQTFEKFLPKLEWEPFRDEFDLGFESYLVPAGATPQYKSAKAKAKDWYWELGEAEPLEDLQHAGSFVVQDRSMQSAFDELTAHLADELEGEVRFRVGGNEQRNVETEMLYRNVSTGTVFLPYWFATFEQDGQRTKLQVNGQTGAVRAAVPDEPMKDDERNATMNERTYEPKAGVPDSSYTGSLIGAIGIGLMVGAVLGLANSPVVGAFIGAVGAALAALLGLNDRHFSKAKGIRIGAFGVAVVVAAPIGIYVRDHKVLAPEPPARVSYLAKLKADYIEVGFTEEQAMAMLAKLPGSRDLTLIKKELESVKFSEGKTLEILEKIALRETQAPSIAEQRSPTQSPAQDNPRAVTTTYSPGDGALHNTQTDDQVCTTLGEESMDSRYAVSNFNIATKASTAKEKWAPLIAAAKNEFEDEDQIRILLLARDADCKTNNLGRRVTLDDSQCDKLSNQSDPMSLFASDERAWITNRLSEFAPQANGTAVQLLAEFSCN